jgi:hypothetical protein
LAFAWIAAQRLPRLGIDHGLHKPTGFGVEAEFQFDWIQLALALRLSLRGELGGGLGHGALRLIG